MQTLPLGNTGVEVSALCLGTMYFGSKEDEQTGRALLDQLHSYDGSLTFEV